MRQPTASKEKSDDESPIPDASHRARHLRTVGSRDVTITMQGGWVILRRDDRLNIGKDAARIWRELLAGMMRAIGCEAAGWDVERLRHQSRVQIIYRPIHEHHR